MTTDLFKPGRSLLHSLDPRPKLLLLLLLSVIFFLPFGPAELGLYALLLCVCTLFSLGPRDLFVSLRSIFPILILVALLTPPFNLSGEVFLRLGGRPLLTSGGLLETLRLVSRFLGVTLLFFLFFRTTETENFILALLWYGLPSPAALTLTITVRYIPYIFSLYGQIKDAHRLRLPQAMGRRQGMRVRFGSMIPILVSVVIQSIRSIPNLAMSLESRGVGRNAPRTSYLSLPPVRVLPFMLCLALPLLLCLPLFL
jgi:energy-coupling factor transport system permease protein